MHSRTTELASIGILFLLSACTEPRESLVIEGAEPDRLEARPDLDVALIGRGFGLEGIAFDLTRGRGEAAQGQFSARLLGPEGFTAEVPPENVSAFSPRRLNLRIRLPAPPPLGAYTVQLHLGDELAAEASNVLVLVGPGDDSDAGVSDAEASDSGADAGILGFSFRQAIEVTFPRAVPPGLTLRLPVPHAQLVAEGARADGRDLRVARGDTPLPFQWEDDRALGTDDLVMVVGLTSGFPAGPAEDLQLLFGSDERTAPTDEVFLFAERFSEPLAPMATEVPDAWLQAPAWGPCPLDRSQNQPLSPDEDPGALCAGDTDPAPLTRDLLGSPVVSELGPLPLGQIFEMRLWLAGRTVAADRAVLYFALGDDNAAAVTAELLPESDWSGFTPAEASTFAEDDGRPRSVEGWRFGPDGIEWWREAVARFTVGPARGQSLHLRRIATGAGAEPDSFFGVDDWTVRRALDPEPEVTLGPIEAL